MTCNADAFTYSQGLNSRTLILPSPGDLYFFGDDNYLLSGDIYFFGDDTYFLKGDNYFLGADNYFLRTILTFSRAIFTFFGRYLLFQGL
jgi:hypothetical protein